MPNSSLAKKLVLKPGNRFLVLNAPDGYLASLGELPPGVGVEQQVSGFGQYDLAQVFVRSKAEAEAFWKTATEAVKPGGILWMAFPKKTSAIKTDINRDVGWDSLKEAGWDTVTAIAIDENWSALRFKPVGVVTK